MKVTNIETVGERTTTFIFEGTLEEYFQLTTPRQVDTPELKEGNSYKFLNGKLQATGGILDANNVKNFACVITHNHSGNVECPSESYKPQVDWTDIDTKYKWLTKDADGSVSAFAVRPKLGKETWNVTNYTDYYGFGEYQVVSLGTCDWKDSLVERPAPDKSQAHDVVAAVKEYLRKGHKL